MNSETIKSPTSTEPSSLSTWLHGWLGVQPGEVLVAARNLPHQLSGAGGNAPPLCQAALDAIDPLNLSPDHAVAFQALAEVGPGRSMNGWGMPYYRDILLSAPGEFTPRQKAFAWLMFAAPPLGKGSAFWRHLLLLRRLRVPGAEEFRNLDEFRGVEIDMRPAALAHVEDFIRGDLGADDFAKHFLKHVACGAPGFPAREMFLYACANCHSVERFQYVAAHIAPLLGDADFVDALGYSPFFYTLFREDSVAMPPGSAAGRWPAVDMGAFLGAIRAAGARPDRMSRHGFSWEDVMAVAEEFRIEAEALCPGGWGVTLVSLEQARYETFGEIKAMLLSDPDAGIAALWRKPFLPESVESPFGEREQFVSDLICDRALPSPVRARLMALFVQDNALGGMPIGGQTEKIPSAFLNTLSGRKWYCAKRLPGNRDIRASDPFFFAREQRFEAKTPIEKRIKEAIQEDSPAKFIMNVDLVGGLKLPFFHEVLRNCLSSNGRSKILDWLRGNDETVKDLLDERTTFFYVCSNWPDEAAAAYVEEAEKRHPGFAKSCVDPLGRNLLWYSHIPVRDGIAGFLRNWRRKSALADVLLRAGCDPDAETVWGLSWRDMDGLRQEADAEGVPVFNYDVLGDGRELKEDEGLGSMANARVGRFQELTVVDRRTGEALSWKYPGGHRVKLYRNGFVLDETLFFVRRADGMIRFHGEVKLLTHSAYGGPVKSSIHNFMLKRIG